MMEKKVKVLVLLVSAVGLLGFGTQALAGGSVGVAVTSNYIGRGLTQTQDDDPALQLDLNYTTQSGLYADVWGSNVKFAGVRDQELDYSVGFKKDLDNGFGFDVGAIKYDYPKQSSPNYAEAYAKVSYKGVGAEVYRTVSNQDPTGGIQNGDLYYVLTYEHDLANDWKYGLQVGRDDFKAANADYNHAGVSLTKSFKKAGDLTVAVDHAKGDGAVALNGNKDTRVSLTWAKDFEF